MEKRNKKNLKIQRKEKEKITNKTWKTHIEEKLQNRNEKRKKIKATNTQDQITQDQRTQNKNKKPSTIAMTRKTTKNKMENTRKPKKRQA